MSELERNLPTILVDIDNTMWDLTGEWVRVLNETYGYDVSPEDIVDYYVQKAYPGLTNDQVYWPFYDRWFWNGVKPLAGCYDVLKEFQSRGYRIKVVTATDYKLCKPKFNALLRHFDFLDYKDIIISYDKHMIYGEVLIDDNPEYLVGRHGTNIMLDCPYNRDKDYSILGVQRVRDWYDVKDVIDKEFLERNDVN